MDLQLVIESRRERGLRREQNWVGGPGWSPLRAAFVPPPEAEVPRLVADLARFVTDTTGNPLVRAAIAHAQFDTGGSALSRGELLGAQAEARSAA